jgi:hypothetical protein
MRTKGIRGISLAIPSTSTIAGRESRVIIDNPETREPQDQGQARWCAPIGGEIDPVPNPQDHGDEGTSLERT